MSLVQLSIIVPVYNVEKYIAQCLQSIFSQIPNEGVEVIIVDDGSPDRSMSIVAEILGKQSFEVETMIKIIAQKNQGLSAARNTGILHASGQYLAFLDSDDYLSDDYINTLLYLIQARSPDIIEFSAQRVTDSGDIFPFLKPSRVKGMQMLDSCTWQEVSNHSAWFAWLRIYKRELFENIKYPLGVNFEDAYTTPLIYLNAKNIYFLPDKLIFYRVNLSGITSTKSIKNIDDLGGAVTHLLKLVSQRPELSASVVSLAQKYIYDSLVSEGVMIAHKRWHKLRKTIIKNPYFESSYLQNKGSRLFLRFGIAFLLLCKIFNK